MALTLDDIRRYVREHIDLEEEDLPNSVLDVFIREGSKRIEQAEKRWPFYEATFSLTTVDGTADYPLASISPSLKEIVAIRGERYEMGYIGRQEGDDMYPRHLDNRAEPIFYSVWADTLRFYPTPNQAYDLEIRAYRKPLDWVSGGAGESPDLPDELHNTVAMWALARAYAQQDDPEMASVFERQFNDEVNLFRRRINGSPAPQPIVLNGHTSVRRPWRLRYDWE